MKKIYLLSSAALLSVGALAQTSLYGHAQVQEVKPFVHNCSVDRLSNPDTTGWVNFVDFMPQFGSVSGNAVFYSYTGGGYVYGNNVSVNNLKIVAQGYLNIAPTPVKIIGAIVWFGGKQSDAGSSASSKVTISIMDMASNKAYNTNGSGTFNSTTLNAVGPTGSAKASADVLFTDIDTVNWNYVAFATPTTCVADFAIVADFTPLAAGDTAGLVSDSKNDAANLDYAFHKIGTKWFVTDQLFSSAATGGSLGFDNDIALFAVVSDATGVNEFFNGMKLTTYPNPTTDHATIEYTLEKNSNGVSLVVFDQHGRKVVNNNYSNQSAGTYKVEVDAQNLAAGTYYYQLKANGSNFTKKFVVTK